MDPLLRKELGSAPWTNKKKASSSKLFYWLTKKSDPFNCRLSAAFAEEVISKLEEGATPFIHLTCCYFPSFNCIVRDDFSGWGQKHS